MNGYENIISYNNATNNYDGFIVYGVNNKLFSNTATYNKIVYQFDSGSCRNEISNNVGYHNVVNGISRDVSCSSCSSGILRIMSHMVLVINLVT